MSDIVWHDFKDSDWYAFGGAVSFAPGAPPLLAELHIDNHVAVVVFDASGLTFLWTVEGRSFDARAAASAVPRLRAAMTLADLRALPGFATEPPEDAS